jgi:hypothetical protein
MEYEMKPKKRSIVDFDGNDVVLNLSKEEKEIEQTQEKLSIRKPIEKEAQSEYPLPDDFPDRLKSALPYFEEVEDITYSLMHLPGGNPVKESSLITTLFESVAEAKDALIEYIAILDEKMPKEKQEMAPPNEFWSEGNKDSIEKKAWDEADEDADYYTQERNRDKYIKEHGSPCPYYYHFNKTFDSPEESGCKHGDSPSGVCDYDDCPLDESSKREVWSSKKSIIKKSQTLEELYQDLERVKRTLIQLGNEQRGDNEEFYEKLHRAYEEILDAEKMLGKAASKKTFFEKKADYMDLGNDWQDEYAKPEKINNKIRNAIRKDLKPLHDKTYFEDFTEAIDIVAEALNKNGFEGDKIMTGIYTGDEGKMDAMIAQNAGIHIQWYRMPSGKYEFNVYVS